MEKATKAKIARFPFATLAHPLAARDRSRVAAHLHSLLRWQRTLTAWPSRFCAPDATPFVSVYARGRMVGCFGSDEGPPSERLSRAFLRALFDTRFVALSASERSDLSMQVSYLTQPRRTTFARAEAALEPGTDGLAFRSRFPDRPATLLLPQVAVDNGLTAAGMLEALEKKAGLTAADRSLGELFLFRAQHVSAHGATRVCARGEEPLELAVDWLARLIGSRGEVCFAIDPRTGARHAIGPMHHGRGAVVIKALAQKKQHAGLVATARERMRRDITRALRGHTVAGWPDDPARVGGTLALAVMAGVEVRAELLAFASATKRLAEVPWHAAQVVTALGPDAPHALWRATTADLSSQPWAPWTALAAAARNEWQRYHSLADVIRDSIRSRGPFIGGASGTPIPEVARTALAVEALAVRPSSHARAAMSRARQFIATQQILPDNVPAAIDRAVACGAFVGSPVTYELRGDITAHALVALEDR